MSRQIGVERQAGSRRHYCIADGGDNYCNVLSYSCIRHFADGYVGHSAESS